MVPAEKSTNKDPVVYACMNHTRKNPTTRMIKSFHVETLAILGGIADLGSFPLLHLARVENWGDVECH